MNIKHKFLMFLLGVLLISHSYPVYADDITICSFNIQFLGSSKIKDNEALTNVVKNYDIVVIQELVAPPYRGTFPDGTSYRPVRRVAKFFDLMRQHGFTYILSEEDTGKGDNNHLNSNNTEWWVVFYKDDKVKYANDDLPSGFLEQDVTANLNYDRVPYAFPFRTKNKNLDFVLISVHLHPKSSSKGKARRYHELHSIYEWIYENNSKEKDFIIIGDMNIQNKKELDNLKLDNYESLNNNCVRTNTNIKWKDKKNYGAKPYDHIMYNVLHTIDEIDFKYGFKVVDLTKAMISHWNSTDPYPGYYQYKGDHNSFKQYYSDHHPVIFRMVVPNIDDD